MPLPRREATTNAPLSVFSAGLGYSPPSSSAYMPGGPKFANRRLRTRPLHARGRPSSSVNHETTRSVPPRAWEGSPLSRELFARSARTIRLNPTKTLQAATAKPRFRAGAERHRASTARLRYTRRETDLARGEKRALFSPQSAGPPRREGVRAGPRLPSHSTRPGLPRSFAVRLARRGQVGSVSIFRINPTASVVR